MDVQGPPYQGAYPGRKERYLGSLKSHCIGVDIPVICYTHEKSLNEVQNLKEQYNLDNLEIKLLELHDMKLHSRIKEVRDRNFDESLDGRGPEIMWGKFDVLERELEGFDRVYWIDAGIQHPGIFTWRYSGKYNTLQANKDLQAAGGRSWWSDLEVYNSTALLNQKIYDKLNYICKNKLVLLSAEHPQISYPFSTYGIQVPVISKPFPIGGLVGGDVARVKQYIEYFWEIGNQVLDKNFLCTEEVLMKVAYDRMKKDEVLTFTFEAYYGGEHDDFHFNQWTVQSNYLKPFYTVWQDILNYEL